MLYKPSSTQRDKSHCPTTGSTNSGNRRPWPVQLSPSLNRGNYEVTMSSDSKKGLIQAKNTGCKQDPTT